MKSSVILPVEVQSRELDAKLLLAGFLAEDDRRVFLGCQQAIKRALHRLPQSILVAKGLDRDSTMFPFARVERLGHAVVAWDEEALVYMTRETYLRRKVAREALGTARALIAWGEDNAEIWRGAPGYAGQPVFVTGNPRADLLRPEIRGYFAPEAERLRRRYGRFVLVSSNFGFLHRADRRPLAAPLTEEAAAADPDSIGTLRDPAMLAHRRRVLDAIKAMLPALAAGLQGRTLIVRPHPSEDPAHWQALAEPCGNLRVVREGAIVPWLMAADALLHNGCTTAVEASLLGTPSIAYEPIEHPLYDMRLPNRLSPSAKTADAVLELVGAESAAAPSAEQQTVMRQFVAQADGGKLAAERIAAAFDELAEAGIVARDHRDQPASRRVRGALRNAARAPGRALRDDGWQAAVRERFPDLPKHDVEARLARFHAVLGRFGDLRVAQRGRNIFEISRRPA